MSVLPALPPQAIPVLSGFDYVTADPKRHRIYASHTASNALSVIDSRTGKTLGQIDVGGPPQGVAVDPKSGDVYNGNSTARTVTKSDPSTMKVVGSVDVPGNVDAIAYDPNLDRVYADEDDGTRLFVIKGSSMKLIATVSLPGHKPEFLDIDPTTHAVYQNIDDLGEVAIVDPTTLKVTRTFKTAAVSKNHPLQFDPTYAQIVVGGKNKVLAAYTPSGALVGSIATPTAFDQCALDRSTHELACAGDGTLALFRLHRGAAPTLLGTAAVDPDAHTEAIDPVTHRVFIVYATEHGDFSRAYRMPTP